uniref:Reverse transcriptase domain-containing protein n=1 Tax=Tanacetum cinerariifolium TaxID=118510 RepID=A0A699IQ36_TANCI|nr:reverse transcriptase domain-containing protein [Tanacetum cinerariifolium]
MSTNEQTPISQPTFAVRNMLGKEQVSQDSGRRTSDAALREYCERNYHRLLPIIAEKVHQEKVQQEKLKAVKAQLNFEEASQYSELGTPSKRRSLKERLRSRHVRSMSGSPKPRRDHSKSPRKKGPERITAFKRLDKGVFHMLGDKGKRKQSSLLKNVITKEHPHEGWNRCQEVKTVREDTGRQNPSDESQALRTICPNPGQKQNFKKRGFRNQQRSERKQDRFTLLTKTPKEIMALDKGKFKPLPSMTTPVEKRNAGKFCEFHGKVGHTSECKGSKKGETSGKEKPLAILMGEDGTESLMIIEAEMGGHFVHRMYVDGGSSSEILKVVIPYNEIIGRPGVRRIQAVPSTAHGMLKFLVTSRTVTLRSSRIIPLECSMVSGPGTSAKGAMRPAKVQPRYIRLEASRYDWSSTSHSRAQFKYSRRMSTH